MATNTIGAGVVLNEGQIDVDFRVEGNNNANVLMVDGGNDRVGIGIAAPTQQLNIHGGSSNGELSVNSNGNDAVIYLSESNTDPTTYGAQLYYSNVDDAFHIKEMLRLLFSIPTLASAYRIMIVEVRAVQIRLLERLFLVI